MVKTVIISDCHFGYERFNNLEFERFLDQLQREGDVARLVLLGDIFDLWRADPVNSISFAYGYLERLQKLGVETHYVVGNHDYHNWISCLALDLRENFLWMKVHYPHLVLDGDIFLVHGDYFDIHRFKVAEKAIYAVYEAIYYAYEPVVRALEKYFWNPVELLKRWVELYRRSPAKAKGDPLAEYLKTIVNVESPREVHELNRGLKYLADNVDVAAHIFIPAYMRPTLRDELPSLLKRRITKRRRTGIKRIDTSAPVRVMLFKKRPLDLAREISGDAGITKVIYGHTHKAENMSSEGYWNTGSWVEGESTFAEAIDGEIHLYRMMKGIKTEIT